MSTNRKSRKPHLWRVDVSLKEGVLDPQGTTIRRALIDMGYKNIKEVKSGKFFEIELDGDRTEEAVETLEEVCKKLLANPVIERYEIKRLK
jgi:phosphoribosylformylglycinamidine synthase PurS subunit